MIDGPDNTPPPLPREWLPDASPLEDAPDWDAPLSRIMAAAEPELRGLGGRRSTAEVTGWSVMGGWWRPAGALVAAATVLLLLAGRVAVSPEPPPGSIPLGLVASEGDPAALWGTLGVRADPVLAFIAIHDPWIQKEDNR